MRGVDFDFRTLCLRKASIPSIIDQHEYGFLWKNVPAKKQESCYQL